MRPTYETPENLLSETAVTTKLERAWKCTIAKCPPYYHVDRMVVRGEKVRAFIEIKCRNNPQKQYPTYMISTQKIIHGLALAEAGGVPFHLVVQWTDFLGSYCVWKSLTPDLRIGGRTDRNDPQDVEPVFHIPVGYFVKIKI